MTASTAGTSATCTATGSDRVLLDSPSLIHIGRRQLLHLHRLQSNVALGLAELDPVLELRRGQQPPLIPMPHEALLQLDIGEHGEFGQRQRTILLLVLLLGYRTAQEDVLPNHLVDRYVI